MGRRSCAAEAGAARRAAILPFPGREMLLWGLRGFRVLRPCYSLCYRIKMASRPIEYCVFVIVMILYKTKVFMLYFYNIYVILQYKNY